MVHGWPLGSSHLVAPVLGDRLLHAPPMAEQHAELLQISVAEVGENIDFHAVVAKDRLVLAEPQASKPIPDVLCRVPK